MDAPHLEAEFDQGDCDGWLHSDHDGVCPQQTGLSRHVIQKPPEEDFGQTLAVWGSGPGRYLVIPIIGPSNHRDLAGYIVDSFMDPIFWIPGEWWYGLALKSGKLINNASLRIGEYEDFKKGAIDPYVSMRTAYQQYRLKEIAR